MEKSCLGLNLGSTTLGQVTNLLLLPHLFTYLTVFGRLSQFNTSLGVPDTNTRKPEGPNKKSKHILPKADNFNSMS